MDEMPDLELLRQFADSHSESAFATLVHRHLNLVYSAALRQMGSPHAAEEIAQVVFIILAQKAATIRDGTVLAGWLVRTTRFAAANALDKNRRRVQREQEAYMQSTLHESEGQTSWENLAPLLDEALSHLGESDRAAIVLRYFQGKNLNEVGLALGTTEDTARKRVARSLEKLRKIFSKRGAVAGAAALAAMLAANGIQAAPEGLAGTIIPAAVAKGTVAGTSTFTLLKGTLKLMAWTKAKTVVALSVVTLLTAGTATVAVKKFREPSMAEDLWLSHSSADLEKMPKTTLLRPTKYPKDGGWYSVDRHYLGRAQSLEDLIRIAYNGDANRTEYPPDLHPPGKPALKFDFLFNLPDGNDEAIRLTLKKQFGVTAHREKREKDSLLLKVITPNAPGLKPATRSSGSSTSAGNDYLNFENGDFGALAGSLQHQFHKPINDATGVKTRYDMNLKWGAADEPNHRDLEKVLAEDFGVELVPSVETIEVLVVQREGKT